MSRGEEKGKDLVMQAEKKLNSSGMFSFFTGGMGSKQEDAAELYDKAAAQFKIAKCYDQAADAYVRAAELSEKLKNTHEASKYYHEAAKAYKNVSASDAVKMFTVAVTLHMDNNRFSTAAKLYKEIAELEEKQMNVKEAIQAWTEAANCYEAEDSKASANKCLLQVAALSASENDYKRAIQIYEQVATVSSDNNLARWSVKDYLFKAALCHLVLGAKQGDIAAAESALQRYIGTFAAFDVTRESTFLTNIFESFNKEDVEEFTTHIAKYDSIYKLDPWTAKILLDVKTILKDGPDGGAAGPGDDLDFT